MPLVAARFHRGRRKFYKYAQVKKEMESVHENVVKPRFLKEFRKIVANWRNAPGFASRKVLNSDGFRIYVYPTGNEEAKQLWQWNVEGTRAHAIVPVNAPMLRFEWGGKGSYVPKTGPGGKWYGGPGTVVNGTTRYSMGVMHPGTEPRNWPEVVAEQEASFYSREVENAWRRSLRKINS
jgi:hypothetical protein